VRPLRRLRRHLSRLLLRGEKGKDPKTGKDGMVLLGIDYQFCKGCLRCTHICKFGALVPAKEAEQDMEKITVKHKFLKK
jgi:pyruvate ferredoxin oxidoreductase gamma subunit